MYSLLLPCQYQFVIMKFDVGLKINVTAVGRINFEWS